MGVISRIKGMFEKRAYDPLALLGSVVSGGVFGGGADVPVKVTESTAMRQAAVWACVRTISETIAGLPFHVYREEDGVRSRDKSHPVNDLVYRSPNEYMSSFTFRDVMLTNLLLHGNAFAAVERGPTGHPVALLPIPSQDVTVKRVGGQLLYSVRTGDVLTADAVIHLLAASWNGIVGISPIQTHMSALGLAVSCESFGNRFFSKGASLNGVFERTGNVSPEAAAEFKKQWTAFYSGLANSHGTPMLPLGVTYKSITIPPESAQFLETRKYQRGDIAAIYRCPPYVVGSYEHSTFSNLESQGRMLVQHTLAPWILRLETEITRKCFREDEQGTYSVKLNVDALQRGDQAARTAYYANGRQWGYLSQNDIRALEDLEPIEGGDTYLQPVNMAPVGTAPAPAPAATRALVEDAARRLLAKEGKALLRAAKKFSGKPAEFRQWAEAFYQKHVELVARTVAPPLLAAGLPVSETDYAARHCADSLAAVLSAFEAGNVDELVDEFETTRPAEVVDQLINPQQ